MKIRKGFVSNSSSSSFVLLKTHEKGITKKELIALSVVAIKEMFGDDVPDTEDLKYYLHFAKKYAKKNKSILSIIDVEFGAEESILYLCDVLRKHEICEVDLESLED